MSVAAGNTYYKTIVELTADIDFEGATISSIGYGVPGQAGNPFRGQFNGNNHTIKNLVVRGTSGVGLFGSLDAGKIYDLNIDNISVYGNHYVGGIVGYAVDNTTEHNKEWLNESIIKNCNITNSIVTCTYKNDDDSGDKAGMIAGVLYTSRCIDCTAKDSFVYADRDAGQLFGLAPTKHETSYDYTKTNVQAINVTVGHKKTSLNSNSGTNIKNELAGRI